MTVAEQTQLLENNVLNFASAMPVAPKFELDPLKELLAELNAENLELDSETEILMESSELEERPRVLASQAPDQSMFVLEQQLEKLNQSLNRLKFYVNDLEELLPGNFN